MLESVTEEQYQSEFERLAALPDRCEIRIVIAREKHCASIAARREDHGTPDSLADALATAVTATLMKTGQDLGRLLADAGAKMTTRVTLKEDAR